MNTTIDDPKKMSALAEVFLSENSPDLLDLVLSSQKTLPAAEQFARWHDNHQNDDRAPDQARYYRALMPARAPGPGEQWAFEVDLDRCSACKSCVSACHSLNGLEENELWRSVGTLLPQNVGSGGPVTVTTACHHCVEPGCLKGCPVAAYEKDAGTGVVRHLDDQCIGCQYCQMTCPYDVPQYSTRLGIVRKCDMCYDRLTHDEAPACVQSCPSQAIRITVVSQAAARQKARQGEFLPDSPDPRLTTPTTLYRSSHLGQDSSSSAWVAADRCELKPQPAHWPLVVMLTFTQVGWGVLAAQIFGGQLGWILPETGRFVALVGWGFLMLGLAASVLHLGQPLKAWRFFLGLRSSWLSREILAFGMLSASATVSTALLWLDVFDFTSFIRVPDPLKMFSDALVLLTGLGAIFTSVMVYAATGRALWSVSRVSVRFLGTVFLAALAAACLGLGHREAISLLSGSLFAVACGLVCWEGVMITRGFLRRDEGLARAARLLCRDKLRRWFFLRMALLMLGAAWVSGLAFWAPAAGAWFLVGLAFLLGGEIIGRMLFFRACVPDKMPGGL